MTSATNGFGMPWSRSHADTMSADRWVWRVLYARSSHSPSALFGCVPPGKWRSMSCVSAAISSGSGAAGSRRTSHRTVARRCRLS